MADGVITITTRLDPKGFVSGADTILSSLKKLALGIVAAFGVKIGIEAVASVAKLSAEFQRLGLAAQAVGQLFGISAADTRAMVKEIIDLGIQTDVANRAFINFTREGLDTSLLPSLARGAQDLNVFAEAGASSSEVLDSLLHGILTLNPLILRNAGAAVDLEESYRKLASEMGKSSTQLTVQEKRQAALIAVTEKLQGVTGLYEISQKTAAGQLASNVRIMNEFKAAIGAPFQAAFFTLIKAWNDLLKAMTSAITTGGVVRQVLIDIGAVALLVAKAIAALFSAFVSLISPKTAKGVQDTSEATQSLGASAGGAAQAQDKLGKSVEGAGKKAKGALAAFDQLDVLQQDIGSGAGAGAGELEEPFIPSLGSIDPSQFGNAFEEVEKRAEEFKARILAALAPITGAFQKVIDAARPLGQTLFAGLQWVWENVLRPLGEWARDTLLPDVFELMAAGAELLNEALIALGPLFQEIFDNLIKPLAESVGQVLVDVLGLIADKFREWAAWIRENPEKFRDFVTTLLEVVAGIWLAIKAVGVLLIVIGSLGLVIMGAASPLLLFKVAIGFLIAAIIAGIAIFRKFGEAFGVVEQQKQILNGFIVFIQGVFTGNWKNAWEGVTTIFRGVVSGWVQIIRAVFNNLIDLVNGLIYRIVSGFNFIAQWGALFGLGVPALVAPLIPRLATGAVIPPNAEFLAVLGDQRSGKNIEAPENLIRQIIREELGNLGGTGGDQTIENVLMLDGEVIYRNQKRVNMRHGKSLLAGGAA